VKLEILGPVNYAHPSARQLFENPIVGYCFLHCRSPIVEVGALGLGRKPVNSASGESFRRSMRATWFFYIPLIIACQCHLPSRSNASRSR